MTTAVDRYRATRIYHPALGFEVYDPRSAKTIFRGQRSGDQGERGNQARIKRLAEDADTLRQDDAVQAVLKAVVLTAHMELPKRVLGDIRRLHDHLIEQLIVAARLGTDRRFIDLIGRSP